MAENNEQKKENSQYSKIQFIGMCISTTPGSLDSIEGTSDYGRYLGDDDAGDDISDRSSIIINALDKIKDKIDTNSTTLKVFVIPEFFFRGSQGAYIENIYLIFMSFLEVEFSHYPDWLFVLGTLVTSKDPITGNEPAYHTGDNLLDVYYRLHPKNTNDKSPSLHSLLKALDGKDSAVSGATDDSDLPYQDILKDTLNYCDSTAGIVIDNSCIIMPGGGDASEPVRRVLKKNKSKEDFVLNNVYGEKPDEKPTGYLQSITKYADIPGDNEEKQSPDDPYAIFEYQGIRFGIDICLDHSRQRLFNFLKAYPQKENYVDVQIVTSCGMSIRENAVIAKKGSPVFNCDGEYTLADDKKATDGNHSHTSLRTVQQEINPADPNSAAVLSDNIAVANNIPFTVDDNFFPYKDCNLHIYPPQELP